MSDSLIALAFAFMLVFCRCGAAMVMLPGFGEDALPAMLRAGLTLALTLLLLPVEAGHMPAPASGFLPMAGMIAAELLAGGLLGWLARLWALALPACGQIISLMTGLSSILQPDATLGAQSAVIGRLFAMLAPALILATGLYAQPLRALAGSYAVFPAGVLLGTGDLAEVAIRAVGSHFALALRLASPFILVSVVWQVALGLLSRLVPQIQVYFASLPGQVLGGILLLAVLGGGIVRTWLDAVADGFGGLP